VFVLVYQRRVYFILRTMVRRIASQVHQQVARLMRGEVVEKIPAWYDAVLAHPPLPLPPKAPAPRQKYDLPESKATSKRLRPQSVRPLPIYYVEDDIRRQFFRDHPFEAFRPKTLTEQGGVEEAHPVQGLMWIRLRQRGRNPSPEECVLIYLASDL
jgi:small subunit ribosomal protein S23